MSACEPAAGTAATSGRRLAVLVVAPGCAGSLDRTLASVATWLPDAEVHVWVDRTAATPDVAALATHVRGVSFNFSESELTPVKAINRFMSRIPERDVLLLDGRTELAGPLTRARQLLAGGGIAAVSPPVVEPGASGRPWDVARRPHTVVRDLVGVAGWAERLRGTRFSELYAGAPQDVDGYLRRCCLLMSREAWEAIGPFEERFFDGGADAAWQLAARAGGWAVRLLADEPAPRRESPPQGDVLAVRVEDLDRASRTLVLGLRGNAGPGALFSGGALLLERLQRRARTRRLEWRTAAAARADGRPTVVVSTNNLDIGGAERQRVMLANELVGRGFPVVLVVLQRLGPYTAELDPRVRLALQPWWQPLVDAPTQEAVLVGGVTNTELGFALGWRALGASLGQRRYWLPASHDPAALDRPTYTGLQARILRSADGLLLLGPQHHADLTRFQRLADTVMIAPNGIPTAAERTYRPAAEGGPVRFGMLTRILSYKNPLLLAEALDALDRPEDWTLDIFGDGPDRAALEARTPSHLRSRVRWRGRSSVTDEAFEQIDVLCVPSGFEAFPLVMVEAMMRGVPVMASASGEVPAMLDDGRAGVVVAPLTRERWTAALRDVIDDPAATAALGAAGRARALARYTVEAMTDDYERAFAQLLRRPLTPAGNRATPAA